MAHNGAFFASGSADETVKVWYCRRLEKDVSFRSRLTYAGQGEPAARPASPPLCLSFTAYCYAGFVAAELGLCVALAPHAVGVFGCPWVLACSLQVAMACSPGVWLSWLADSVRETDTYRVHDIAWG